MGFSSAQNWIYPINPTKEFKSSPLVESTLTEGQTVFHFMYGEGEIRSFTDTKIYIQFEIGLRMFPLSSSNTKEVFNGLEKQE